ncbi:MAG: alpha/beta family hydrolase [Vicinamibacterales bacterium]
MRFYETATPDAPALLLAHGAGAGEEHPWMQRVAGGLSARGVTVATFNFPYRDAGRRLPDKGAVLEDALCAAWETLASRVPAATVLVAGGKSMGGRIASQVMARRGLHPPPSALVLFGYPLHPPGKPSQRRDAHLPELAQPSLFLHGTRDPFGSPEEMRALMSTVPGGSLAVIDGGDHSLVAGGRGGAAGVSLEHAMDTAAAWILALAAHV